MTELKFIKLNGKRGTILIPIADIECVEDTGDAVTVYVNPSEDLKESMDFKTTETIDEIHRKIRDEVDGTYREPQDDGQSASADDAIKCTICGSDKIGGMFGCIKGRDEDIVYQGDWLFHYSKDDYCRCRKRGDGMKPNLWHHAAKCLDCGAVFPGEAIWQGGE